MTDIATLRDVVEDAALVLDAERADLVERQVTSTLLERGRYGVVEVVSGVRRSGKSTLLLSVGQGLRRAGRAVHYLNFEDERLSPKASDLGDISSLLRLDRAVLLLDEPQNMPGWERWVRRMHDRGTKVYVTGSNSRLLGGELSTALAGRKRQHGVFPFSFEEYLRAKRSADLPSDQRLRLLEEYIVKGGFPYPTVSGDAAILQDYREDIVGRDVLMRHRIADPVRFKDLVRFLMSNPGVYLSSRSVKGFLDISHPTLRKYLGYLEDAYAVIALEKYSRSTKVRMLNPRKVYPVDNGLLTRGDDKGRLLESVVVQHLRRATDAVFYWKDARNREVDAFLPEEGLAVQVAYELDEANVAREVAPLRSAQRELRARGVIVSMYPHVDTGFPLVSATDLLRGDPIERLRSAIGQRAGSKGAGDAEGRTHRRGVPGVRSHV